MKLSTKVIYTLAIIAVLIGIWMLLTPPNEGGLAPVLIGVGLAVLATYKHLTDRPGK
jgi:hypothetical protein